MAIRSDDDVTLTFSFNEGRVATFKYRSEHIKNVVQVNGESA